jgi:hypothetical protein
VLSEYVANRPTFKHLKNSCGVWWSFKFYSHSPLGILEEMKCPPGHFEVCIKFT